MATLSKRALTLNIVIEEGAQLPINMTIKDKDTDIPFDLTSYTAKMEIRLTKTTPDPSILTLTDVDGISLGGTAGTVIVIITATQASTVYTALMSSGGVYDLELIPPGGVDETWRFLEGAVSVDGEVTK